MTEILPPCSLFSKHADASICLFGDSGLHTNTDESRVGNAERNNIPCHRERCNKFSKFHRPCVSTVKLLLGGVLTKTSS